MAEEWVAFESNGLFLHKHNQKTTPTNIYTHLRSNCEIVSDTTFKEILLAVDAFPELKYFISRYSWCRELESFHAQLQEPMREEETEITHLEIYWVPQIRKHQEKLKHPGGLRERIKTTAFTAYPAFHGVGTDMTHSVSFTPLYLLADLPIKLNEYFCVDDIKITRKFTLLEVLDTIYWDISFFGGDPQEKQDLLDEMNERVDDIKELYEENYNDTISG